MTGVALITGSARGIGRATATAFAADGWRIAVNCRTREDAATGLVAEFPDLAHGYRCDVTDEDSVQRMVSQIQKDLGVIDVLVNNAGLWRGGTIDRLSSSDFRSVLEVSLIGAKNVAAAVLPGMKAKRHGHIINVSSAVGVVGWTGDSAYAAAKAGLIGMSAAWAKELAPFGIRVNVVVPGYIATDMTGAISPRQRSALLDRTLLGKPGLPSDVAAIVHAIATAGEYMTGSVVAVDGGMILGRDGTPRLGGALDAELLVDQPLGGDVAAGSHADPVDLREDIRADS